MMIKAMNNMELIKVLSKELDLPDLENITLVGLDRNNKKARYEYGSLRGAYSNRQWTMSPTLIKQIREQINKGEYFINYMDGTSRCIVHIPLNGAKFMNILDDFKNIIVTKSGSVFDCIDNTWYKNVAEFIKGDER